MKKANLKEELSRMKELAGLGEFGNNLNSFKSAVDAFNNAKEGDAFRVTFVNPSSNDTAFIMPSKNRSEDIRAKTHTSMSELVKQGDFFIEKEDINKSDDYDSNPLKRKRKYLPQDLDKNNKEIILIKI